MIRLAAAVQLAVLIAALLACACRLPAEDAPPAAKLPPDATHLVDAFEADAARIRAAAEQQVQKKASELVKKLEGCETAAMRRQDLDGAEAVKQAIDTYQKVSPSAFDPVGSYTINGSRWTGTWSLLKDFTCSASSSGAVVNNGTWKLDGTTVRISWRSGIKESIDFSDPQKLKCTLNDGETFSTSKF